MYLSQLLHSRHVLCKALRAFFKNLRFRNYRYYCYYYYYYYYCCCFLIALQLLDDFFQTQSDLDFTRAFNGHCDSEYLSLVMDAGLVMDALVCFCV